MLIISPPPLHQLAPTKATPAPTLEPTVPASTTTTAPEPGTPSPVESTPTADETTQSPVQSPDYVLAGSTAAPSLKKSEETPGNGATARDDTFSNLYGSAAYIHSNNVAVIAIVGSAMVWTLAGFM
jgi:hypothetical protein